MSTEKAPLLSEELARLGRDLAYHVPNAACKISALAAEVSQFEQELAQAQKAHRAAYDDFCTLNANVTSIVAENARLKSELGRWGGWFEQTANIANGWKAERDAAIAERDAAIAERDRYLEALRALEDRASLFFQYGGQVGTREALQKALTAAQTAISASPGRGA